VEPGVKSELDELMRGSYSPLRVNTYPGWGLLFVALLLQDPAFSQSRHDEFAGLSIGLKGGTPFLTYGLFGLLEIDSEESTYLMIAVDNYPEITRERGTIISMHVSSNYRLGKNLNLRPYIGLGDYLVLGNGSAIFNFAIHVGSSVESIIAPSSIGFLAIEKSVWLSNAKALPVTLTVGIRVIV